MAVVSTTASHESAVKQGMDWLLLSIAHNPVPVAISMAFFGVSGNGATASVWVSNDSFHHVEVFCNMMWNCKRRRRAG